MKKITIFVLSVSIILACKNNKNEAQTTPVQEPSLRIFGDSISTSGAISVADAMNGLKSNDSIYCAITGFVTSVCQVKGCWMMLSEKPTDTTGFFVKFKGYTFFVPKDLSGSKVTVKGVAYKEVTSVKDLKHYAEDEGKSKEEIDAITAPQEEIKFMADGVVAEKK